jgi:glycosyltransferase involved in cell wall biosynthesis
VVSYNPVVARWAEETWGLDGVDVLPPGVPEAPDVDRTEVRRALGLPADRFLALCAGRDVPKKRLDLFLAAHDPAYDLVAVTDRDPAGAPPGARILPFVEPERFRELLAAVDAFVLPSEAEGFPLALQEALVTGLPCVVTRGPGYEHYLRDGEWIPVEADASAIREALVALAADPARVDEVAARARAAGEREFGVPAFVAAYEGAYEELVATAQPTPLRP